MILNCFFFHSGPLIFRQLPVPKRFFHSFCLLSVAVRLLSDIIRDDTKIECAENLIHDFFQNFVELYDEKSQSFNFHTMRHLGEQVRRNGSLWLFSAFCFDSANHNLISAFQGTIKEPENIIERFVKHQAAASSAIIESTEKCLKGLTDNDAELKVFCEKFGVRFYFSSFVSSDGQCCASLLYSRQGDSLGDCLFQLKDGRFFRVSISFKL